ncbi:protein SCO1/2 [Flavobacterium akiainvivens]|nr:protein SCO1/2 [Flavobacterium akiainvivens]
MKNKSYIGITFIILVFGIIFVPKIINRLSNGTVVQNDRLNVKGGEKDSGLYTLGVAPKFTLINQDGVTVNQDFYKGKVYVLEFFFSTCPSICPIMNKNLVEVQKQFAGQRDFGVASITINPEYDTPAVLKNHKKELGITSENWNFLTGDKDYIHKLSNDGFKLFAGQNQEAAGGFEHSGNYALIDKDGNIRCRVDETGNPIMYYSGLNYADTDGMEEDPQGKYKPGVDALKEDIKKLLDE